MIAEIDRDQQIRLIFGDDAIASDISQRQQRFQLYMRAQAARL